MKDLLIVAIGLGAVCGTTGAWLPQAARTWRTKSAADFSWGYLALLATGVSLWATYGALRGDVVVVTGNTATLFLVASVALVKARPR